VNRWAKDILIALAIGIPIIGMVVGGVIFFTSITPASITPSPVSYPTVKYEITGSAYSVDITLNNATGGTEQYSNAGLPASITYDNFTSDFLYISAQNQGGSGTVTVSIYIDGKLFKTATSSGGYVIATAHGMRE